MASGGTRSSGASCCEMFLGNTVRALRSLKCPGVNCYVYKGPHKEESNIYCLERKLHLSFIFYLSLIACFLSLP